MKKKKAVILLLIILFTACFSTDITFSDRTLTVENYKISTDKTDESFRIVLLSDLHNKEFGKNNERLLNKVKEQNPDIIFTVGDFVTKTETDRKTAVRLLKNLTEIADVYTAHGNHELSYYNFKGLVNDIRRSGVTLLDNELCEVKIGSGVITVGGLTGFPYYEYEAPDYDNPSRHFLDRFIEQEKENFSILLVHQPEYFIWGLNEKEIDLMLCGHTHGGIVRLPFIGGLLAPNQGVLAKNGDLLPKYTKGLYRSDTAAMLITAGLGNEVFVPRFFNPPEVCVIDIN